MSAELMKSKFVCRPFVVSRLSVRVAIISESNVNFLSNFGCCFPGRFLNVCKKKKNKKMRDCLRIFFVFVNMGPYGSEKFKMLLLLQIAAESFQTFLKFLPNGPHKTTFGIFKISKIEILTNLILFR